VRVRRAGVRGRQGVERGVEAARPVVVRHAVAHREELALRIEEESEVGVVHEARGPGGQRREPERYRIVGGPGGREAVETGGKREQRAREVAAVHCGDVRRHQRRQRACVVPVEQVAVHLLQLLNGRERGVDAVRKHRRRNEAEVVCRERREQPHADVGR